MKLDTCGCCEPAAQATPLMIDNRPGLSAIAYRIGTYSSFRQAMLQVIAGTPELAALKTRLSDDYAITLLELWATVAEILTFYQERIANEGFLRTARLRDSVLRMARLIDYQLGPGAAATTLLAFTLEKNAQVKIPVGLKVQSVPGQDEKPQKFETLEAINADARLNRLRLVLAPVSVNPLAKGNTEAFLAPGADGLAVAEALAPGDHFILFDLGPNAPIIEELEVREVRIEYDQIVLAWTTPIQGASWSVTTSVFKVKRRFRLFGYNAPETYMQPVSDDTVAGKIRWDLLPVIYTYSGWPELALDARCEEITVGSLLLVSMNGVGQRLGPIIAVGQTHKKLGPLSDTVTQVTIPPSIFLIIDRRQVLIYELAEPPIKFWGHSYPTVVTTDSIFLPGQKIDEQSIEVGRTIAKNTYQPGVVIGLNEIELGRRVLLQDAQQHPVAALINAVSLHSVGNQDYLKIDLEATGEINLEAQSAVLLGNVARASHGETIKEEILGDGDAAAKFQHFTLQKQPLTYVPSADPGGLKSSLKVLVNRVLWQETPSLYGQSPGAQVHTTRIADDSSITVQFGDNVTGAAPFSGRGNVMAIYRHGLGLAGRVRANTLTTLLDRPVGLKSVTNPQPAEGGADPETLDAARENAPLTVRTFGRAVSLRDFEDLVTATGEIAKAKATWVWNGEARTVHLTVAGQAAGTFSPDALSRIHASLTAQRDPNHTLFLDNFVRVPLVIAATIHIADAYVAADVEEAARTALLGALSFEALRFGQPLHLSDIYAVLQGVVGVVWVKVDLFQFKDQSPAYLAARGADAQPVQEHLRIFAARILPGPPDTVLPAEQAWIEAPTQDITLLTAGGLPI